MEEPRGKKRTVPMQVLALGMSRSGTESLCHALDTLGFPCYHGWRAVENHLQARLWIEGLDAKFDGVGHPWTTKDFDQILGDYAAVTDAPCAVFAPELINAYPDAKVILNVRPTEQWHASALKTLCVLCESWMFWLLCRSDWEAWQIYWCFYKSYTRYFRGSVRHNGATVYDEHSALVRSLAPKDKFLEYDVQQGWEPLCEFLGVPVPDVEFPNQNVADSFHKRIDDLFAPRFKRSFRNLAVGLAATAGVVSYVVMRYRR